VLFQKPICCKSVQHGEAVRFTLHSVSGITHVCLKVPNKSEMPLRPSCGSVVTGLNFTGMLIRRPDDSSESECKQAIAKWSTMYLTGASSTEFMFHSDLIV
jgi:hypothetical protein